MKLIYLTVATIPNKTAHSKYVMKLCEAFSNNAVDTTIISGKPFGDKTEQSIKSTRLGVNENRYKSFILAMFHLFFILKRKIFFQSKDDIYIVHNAYTALACSILKVNYIIDMHSKIFNNQNAKKILFKHLPLFWIVQSNLLKKFVTNEIGIDENNILLSRNAISKVENYQKVNNFQEDDEMLKFAYIGRLKPDTGFHEIIEALNDIEIEFILYVGGDYQRYKDYYEELFEKFPKTKERIVFLGYLNDEQINFVSQNVDVLIALYSSKIDIFGTLSPMKIFEYLRFDKRIIAPKITDIEEIVEYYDCEDRMRWYEIDDVKSLHNTITKVLNESKNFKFKHIDVETWDDKAKNILERINNVI